MGVSLQRWSAQWVVVWLLELDLYNDTMIRILLFSLLISLALGLPYLGSPSAAAYPVAPAGPDHHHVVKRAPEEAEAEAEPEAGDEAESEPEPESESADYY